MLRGVRLRDRPCPTGCRIGSSVRTWLSPVMNSAASQPKYAKLIGSRQSPRLLPLYSPLIRQGPFPPPALPGFIGNTSPSVICLGRPCPSRAGRRSRQPAGLHPNRLPLLRISPLACVLSPLPRRIDRVRVSLASPTAAAFLVIMASRLPHRHFRGLHGVHSHYSPHATLPSFTEGFFLKCFRPFVTSWPAPSASGRSERGRVGISPTGLVRLRQGTHNNYLEIRSGRLPRGSAPGYSLKIPTAPGRAQICIPW